MAIDINNVTLGTVKHRGAEQPEHKAADTRRGAGAQPQEHADKVELSSDAQTLQQVEKRLENAESFDQAKVDKIKQALADGEYPIDNERLASKFYQLEQQLNQ